MSKLCNLKLNSYMEKVYFFKRIEKTYNNQYHKFARVRDKITAIINDCDCPVWITLTFNSDSIDFKSHRQLVYRYLKSQCDNYVANIDFGDEKGRLHYHAVGDCKINPLDWKYGSCKVVAIYNKNYDKISEYITKLSHHAVKESTKGFKTIYSRKRKF